MGVVERPSPVPASLGYGASGPAFFLMTLVLGCLCAGDCLGCSSALWWSMWGREGLSITPFFRITFGMVGAAGGFQRRPFSNCPWHGLGRRGLSKTPFFELPLAWFGPPGTSKDTPFRITLYAPWCVRLPCRAIAKQTHVEPLWGLRGPAWVRGSLIRPWQRRPMWKLSGGSLGLPECAGLPATAMTKQTHVEFFCGLCGPACVCGLAL